MGNISSSFDSNIDDGENLVVLTEQYHPSAPNWINVHAQICEIPVVEVERLWLRFRQLGGSSDGILTKTALSEANIYQDDILKKILIHMPKNKDGGMTFQTFCNASKWCENVNIEGKLRGFFRTLNDGHYIDNDTLKKILKSVYPEDNREAISRHAKVFMSEVDKRRLGYIDEEQFIRWMKNMPHETVQKILMYSIIPDHIQEEFRRDNLSTSHSSKPPPKKRRQAITGDMLDTVATRASARDWSVLANKLGFTLEDVDQLAVRFPKKDHEQIYSMLQTWMSKEAHHATAAALEKALRESQMGDIADEVMNLE